MSALQGVWARAQDEYQEHLASGPGPDDPEQLFCLAYLYGVAFGLALSTVRPDLVAKFEPQFRARLAAGARVFRTAEEEEAAALTAWSRPPRALVSRREGRPPGPAAVAWATARPAQSGPPGCPGSPAAA
jgi:hypothetical protein